MVDNKIFVKVRGNSRLAEEIFIMNIDLRRSSI